MSKIKDSLILKLIIAVAIGIVLGSIVGEGPIEILLTIKYVVGQFIFFCVPLVIIGFIAPAITNLKTNASKMLIISRCSFVINSFRLCINTTLKYS